MGHKSKNVVECCIMKLNGGIIRYYFIRYSSNSHILFSTEDNHMVFSVGHSLKATKQQQNGCMRCLVSAGVCVYRHL